MAANSRVDVHMLEKRIKEILKGADLEKTTAKNVRKQLESELHVDLIDFKKTIGSIIERVINETHDAADDDDNSADDADDGSVDIKSNVEKYPNESSDSSSEDDEKLARKLQEAEEEKARRSTRSGRNNKSDSSKKTKTKKKRKKDSDSDSDEEKPKKKARGGYMKNCQLSQELAAFVGESELPRHQIVKKVWGYVKENNLHDPKNRQFALCDNELMKIFGLKRVRLFGMMKHLQKHIIN